MQKDYAKMYAAQGENGIDTDGDAITPTGEPFVKKEMRTKQTVYVRTHPSTRKVETIKGVLPAGTIVECLDINPKAEWQEVSIPALDERTLYIKLEFLESIDEHEDDGE